MKKVLLLLFVSMFAVTGCSGLGRAFHHRGGTTLSDVSNLTATTGNAEVHLSWTDPDMSVFDHIVVSYSPGGDDTLVKKGDQGILVQNLTNDKEYTFSVTVIDAAGNESEGREINATPSIPSNGTEITGLTVINGNKQVVLNWIDPVDADVKNIQVSWSDTVKTVGLGVQTYTVTGLTNEENYTFTVKTVKKDGGVSSGVAITEKPDGTSPSEVTNVQSSTFDGSIALTWADPSDADFDHVVLSVSGSSKLYTINKGKQYFKAESLANGTSYTFNLKTADKIGNISDGEDVTVELPLVAPDEVTGLNATPGSGKVTLSWVNPSSRFDHAAVTWLPGGSAVQMTTGSSFTATGLANAEEYTFTVRTVGADGATSEGVVIKCTPIKGVNLAEVSSVTTNGGNGQVVLGWTDPTDADFDHVLVTQQSNGYSWTVAKGVGTSTATGLDLGISYTFIIHTVDIYGLVSTGVTAVGTTYSSPSDVQSVSAAVDNGQVSLSWTNPSNFSYAKITWSPGGSQVKTTTGNSFLVTGLSNGTTYTFTIKAVSVQGLESNGIVLPATPAKQRNTTEVSGLTAKSGNCKVTLGWTDPTAADFDHLLVYRNGGSPQTVAKGIKSFTATGLSDGTSYSFTVKTVDIYGLVSTGSTISGSTLSINAARAEKAKGIKYYNRMYISANGAALNNGVVGSIPGYYQSYVTEKLNSRLAFPVSPKTGVKWYQSLPDAVSSYSSSMGWDPAADVTLATVDYMANNGTVLTNSLSALNSATTTISGTDYAQAVADAYNPATETATSPAVDSAAGYDSSKLLKMGVAIAAAYFGDFSGVMSLAGGSEAGYMKQIEAQLSQINAKLKQIEDKLDNLRGLVAITAAEEKRNWISSYRSYMNSVGNTLATLPVLSNPFDELFSFAKNTITGTEYFTNYDDTKTKAEESQGIVKGAVKKDTLTVEVDVERKLVICNHSVYGWSDMWVFVSKTSYDFDKPTYLFTMQPQDMELLKRFGLTRLMFDQYLMGGATPQTGETVLALRRQQGGYDYATFLDPSVSTSIMSGVNAEYSRYFVNSDSAVMSATIDQSTMPSMGSAVETLASGNGSSLPSGYVYNSATNPTIRPVKARVRILDAAGTVLYSHEYVCATSGKQVSIAGTLSDPLSIPYISNTDHAAAITFVRNSLASYAHAKYDDQFKNVYTSLAEWAIIAKANKEQ